MRDLVVHEHGEESAQGDEHAADPADDTAGRQPRDETALNVTHPSGRTRTLKARACGTDVSSPR
ncbi:hypothetical protein ACIBU0_33645 [Streptomyces sp. NPDC049627]|uniref:hypothetical protein n=1 Tax=Streptomyces sp. NPDC049627 TaxID=3365595 RepID=UPI003789FD2B